jgi:hypothetical protein
MSQSQPSRSPGSGEGDGLGPDASWPDDFDAEPTAEELEAARALAEALEGRGAGLEAEFAGALKAAYEPEGLDPARHEALLASALGEKGATVVDLAERRRAAARRAVRWGGATGVLAAAAAAALVLWPGGRREGQPPSTATVAALAPPALASRSTQELFEEPFARSGGGSARIDRIAQARSRDLRQNRFRRWGVQ